MSTNREIHAYECRTQRVVYGCAAALTGAWIFIIGAMWI